MVETQRLTRRAMAFVLAGGRGSRLKELTDRRADAGKGRAFLGHCHDPGIFAIGGPVPVSYTHLTLPTNREV